MPGTMSQTDLIADLKSALMDAANTFSTANDADFIRHLDIAARDLSRFRPRTLLGTITLVADQYVYTAPADMVGAKHPIWGMNERHRNRQWERNFPGKLPRMTLVQDEVHLYPAPSSAQISQLGSDYKFYYFAAHVVSTDAALTTVRASDRHLLLLRASAEALRELSVHQSTKPVRVIQGTGQSPREGMPAALYRTFMEDFERMAS